MTFVAIPQQPGVQTDWSLIDHIRIVEGRRPDTPLALKRWSILAGAAAADGTIPLAKVFELIEPVRNRGGRKAGIKADLRCWSNDEKHGNNSQDKGWLELGRKEADSVRETLSTSTFLLELPTDLKLEATAQADASGVSLNDYIVNALVFQLRGQAKAILARSGIGNLPREDDRLD